jgi:PAS domain S-box-containing protein
MPTLTRALEQQIANAPAELREARRFVRKATVVALVALGAIAASFVVLDRAGKHTETLATQNTLVERVAREAALAADDRETAIRGFLLTGDTRSLEPNERAIARLPKLLDSLDILVRGDTIQIRRLAVIRSTLHAWDSAFAQPAIVGRAGASSTAGAGTSGLAGKREFDEVRRAFSAFLTDADATYERGVSTIRRMRVAIETAFVVEIIAVGTLVYLLRRRLRGQIGHLRTQNTLMAEQATRLIEQRGRLDETAELLARVLDSSPLPIAVMTMDLQVVLWNPAAERLFGWTAEEVIGRMNPMAANSGGEDLKALRDSVMAHGRVLGMRGCRERKDGAKIEIAASAAQIHDRTGACTGFVVLAEDLSVRVNLENQLRHAQKMEAIGRLAGGIAHDFNNILTVITSYADLLLLAPPPDSMLHELSEIRAAAGRAAGLTRQLLAFSRQQVLRPRTLDLNATVEQLRGMLRPLLGEDIDLELDLSPAIPLVHADQGQVEQVVMNLAINARDAMPEGGRLLIETRRALLDEQSAHERSPDLHAGDYAVIRVSDSGVGMSPALVERIFEPFFTTKPVGQGTGLGLSTAYGIVEQSGGAITVESTVGVGTAFSVYLPASLEAAEARLPAAHPRPSQRGSETILVVEDEESLRYVLRRILAGAGYEVIEADNGHHALQVLQGKDVNLVLSDVVMPIMGGRELARELSSTRPGVPVILMSGYTGDARNELVTVNHPYVIDKPFTGSALLETVRDVLDVVKR